MSTTDDFIGKGCPFCGEPDSLETDDVRGEVACTHCARVVALGLEENISTRYEKETKHDDVDAHARAAPGEAPWGAVVEASGGLTRAAAAARAAGLVATRGPPGEAHRAAAYARLLLHPSLRHYLEHLGRIARRGEEVLPRAVAVAKHFVGQRRDRGVRLDHPRETGAACFLLAAEMAGQPLPLGELRTLDPSLKDVETRRREIVAETHLEETERHLREVFAVHLVRYYLRLLHVPVGGYEEACRTLLAALRSLTGVDMAPLVEAEQVVLVVLLAVTEPSLQWTSKPASPASLAGVPPATAWASFAASARLSAPRVTKVMQIAQRHLEPLRQAFHERLAERARTDDVAPPAVGVKRERDGADDTAR